MQILIHMQHLSTLHIKLLGSTWTPQRTRTEWKWPACFWQKVCSALTVLKNELLHFLSVLDSECLLYCIHSLSVVMFHTQIGIRLPGTTCFRRLPSKSCASLAQFSQCPLLRWSNEYLSSPNSILIALVKSYTTLRDFWQFHSVPPVSGAGIGVRCMLLFDWVPQSTKTSTKGTNEILYRIPCDSGAI